MKINELKKELKLFDELLVTEYYLATIIDNWCFPEQFYKQQFENNNFKWGTNESNKETILKNKEVFIFRTKHILFLGYSNESSDTFLFCNLTTKRSEKRKQIIFSERIFENKTLFAYINDTEKIYKANFTHVEFSYPKWKNNSEIVYASKNLIITSLSTKNLKSLSKITSLNLWKNAYQERINGRARYFEEFTRK